MEVYQLKGKEHTHEMLEFLNTMFMNKGLEFTRIIVQNVKLPTEIAQPLDYKAQYGSMNDYERTRHEYDMRLLNDEKELEIIKQMRQQQRTQLSEDFSRQLALVERDLKIIQSECKKSVAEIQASTQAEETKIQAESELQAQIIKAKNLIWKAQLLSKGKAEAKIIEVEADNYCEKKMAEQMNIVSEKNAECIRVEGQAEGELSKVLGLRRLYEYLNAKLSVVTALGNNPNAKIFGDQKDDMLSQMAAYGIWKGQAQLK